MSDGAAVTVALPFIVLLLASGAWASRRFAAFDKLPGHFDYKGRASKPTPSKVMVWLLPGVFSVMLIVITGAISAIPHDIQNDDPRTVILITGISFLAAQGLFLWLTDRWARAQR